jgi:hypothetical protein
LLCEEDPEASFIKEACEIMGDSKGVDTGWQNDQVNSMLDPN